MKTFIVFALCVAAAAANLINPVAVSDEIVEIQQIIEAIQHPSTDSATAAALEQMLYDLLGIKPEGEPISVGPAIIDNEYEPISVGPAIVDNEYEPISVGPAIVDNEYEPISVGPAIVDNEYEPISVGPAIIDTAPTSSPLVQIILNVNSGSQVSVDQSADEYEPISVGPAIIPEPVIVVEKPEITEPINVSPVIIPEAVVVLPDILN